MGGAIGPAFFFLLRGGYKMQLYVVLPKRRVDEADVGKPLRLGEGHQLQGSDKAGWDWRQAVLDYANEKYAGASSDEEFVILEFPKEKLEKEACNLAPLSDNCWTCTALPLKLKSNDHAMERKPGADGRVQFCEVVPAYSKCP